MAKDKSTDTAPAAVAQEPPAAQPSPAPSPDLGLIAENERLAARVAELQQQLHEEREASRRDLEAQRQRFDLAWAEREASLAANPAPIEVARPKKKVAANLLRCHTKAGAKITLQAGQEIPADVDLSGLPADAVVEV